jgi:hypothetical protein
MTEQDDDLPEAMKRSLRALMFDDMDPDTLDIYEIELFEWYVKETEAVLEKMLSIERAYIQDQTEKDVPEINDSGILAVEYYARRMRYSHVIYLVSLLESCLARACSTLITVTGPETKPFGPTELKGDQWKRRRDFMQRYGNVTIPSELWSVPQMLIFVRNCLVHENGSTANIPDDRKGEIRKLQGLDVDGPDFKIEQVYVQQALNGLRVLVRHVEDGIREAIQRESVRKTV